MGHDSHEPRASAEFNLPRERDDVRPKAENLVDGLFLRLLLYLDRCAEWFLHRERRKSGPSKEDIHAIRAEIIYAFYGEDYWEFGGPFEKHWDRKIRKLREKGHAMAEKAWLGTAEAEALVRALESGEYEQEPPLYDLVRKVCPPRIANAYRLRTRPEDFEPNDNGSTGPVA